MDQVPPAPEDRLWLYGVAQRVVAGRHRSARRRQNLTARLRADHGLLAPELPGARDSTRDLLLAALDRLPPAQRDALQLVLWEQLSHAEAARVLGCSVNAVAIRVHRAKERLRDELTRLSLRPDKAPTAGSRLSARLNRS
jgi:RNA polymerase sigma-70 factor (ECF subfamily)